MAIYVTGTLRDSQLNYQTGDAEDIKRDLNISASDISGLNGLVYTTGDQIISGNKNFSGQIGASGIQFLPLLETQTPDYQEGKVFYDENSHSLCYYNEVSDVIVNLGQEHIIRVINGWTGTIVAGRAVVVSGAQGDKPKVIPATASHSMIGDHDVLGLTSHSIPANGDGYITTAGVVEGLDTSLYTVGDTLFVQTGVGGVLTDTRAVPPDHSIKAGYVYRSHPNAGSIFVHLNQGEHLNWLHDVLATGLTSGQVLKYNGILWENSNLSINDLADVDTQTTPLISGDYLKWNGSNWVAVSDFQEAVATGSFSGVFYGDGSEITNVSSDNIDLLFNRSYNTYYHELSYNISGDLTGVGVWENNSKTIQLFSKELIYSGETLTSVITTDTVNSITLTKTLSYDGNENLISTTRIYT
jgi:hypothetical protein